MKTTFAYFRSFHIHAIRKCSKMYYYINREKKTEYTPSHNKLFLNKSETFYIKRNQQKQLLSNDSQQNTDRQPRWNRLPHHSHGQPARNQVCLGVFGRRQELPACEASRRGHLHRSVPGAAKLPGQRKDHRGCQIHSVSSCKYLSSTYLHFTSWLEKGVFNLNYAYESDILAWVSGCFGSGPKPKPKPKPKDPNIY